jgi:hypothetical protein
MSSIGPLSPGTCADDSAVGTVAWANPDNAKVSDNVYAVLSGGTSSHYLKATNFGFSIPTGATINGILLEIQQRVVTSGDGANPSQVRIVKADGSIGTTNKGSSSMYGIWQSTTPAYWSFGSSTDLWGETWTPADINDVDFGSVLGVTSTSAPGLFSSEVDHIRITVYYTEAVASGPANLKSYNTNLKANIKSINTNLLANVKKLDTNV